MHKLEGYKCSFRVRGEGAPQKTQEEDVLLSLESNAENTARRRRMIVCFLKFKKKL
jgi:hypothetical protein